jgi:hypothetical protein
MTDETIGLPYVQRLVYGDMVKDAATAIELAAVLIRRNCGASSLNGQEPLTAREEGAYWWVDGAAKKTKTSLGPGPVHVKLKKTDASVASLYWTLLPEVPDSATKR